MIHDTEALTPVEDKGGIYYKREDEFSLPKVFSIHTGTNARVAAILAKGKSGLTTIHTEEHPQGPLVAAAAKVEGIPCRIHTIGKAARRMPRNPHGATVVLHKSEEIMLTATMADANLTGFTFMPVNLDCSESLASIEKQCTNIPDDTGRIIVCANDEGAVARAILQGMETHGKKAIIVVHGPNTNGVASYFRLFGPDEWHARVHIQTDPPTPTDKDLVWVGNTF